MSTKLTLEQLEFVIGDVQTRTDRVYAGLLRNIAANAGYDGEATLQGIVDLRLQLEQQIQKFAERKTAP